MDHAETQPQQGALYCSQALQCGINISQGKACRPQPPHLKKPIPNMSSPPDTKSEASLIALSQGPDPEDALPSYEEASSSNYSIPNYDRSLPRATAIDSLTPKPAPKQQAPTDNPQRYSSLLPPSAPSLGLPPNYAIATSSIPSDCSARRRPSISPERPLHSKWRLHSSKLPKQEGVPLEEVVDRFGNRKREIKFRPKAEVSKHPVSVRAALRNMNGFGGLSAGVV